jgi:signal transduction histidine kinase
VESKKPDGSGLGLAIARRITARHGGALIVDTGPDQGTSVRVVLPAAPEEGTGVAT